MIARILLSLSFIWVFAILPCAQNWVDTEISFTADRYDDVYFHNPNIGWAVNGNGTIHKTINGGETWEQIYSEGKYFRSIEFLDENIGVAGTLDKVVLRTEDGGETWEEIQDNIPGSIPGICGLDHVGDTFFGVGIFAYPAYFVKSTDKGVSWTYQDLSPLADGLVECHFINEDVGFIAGVKEDSGAIILKTSDGGSNWEEVLNTNEGTEYVWKLDFVSDDLVYGSIESFSEAPSRIVKSIDGGNTWESFVVDSSFLDLQGIGFIDELKGWACPRSQRMYETNDGGITWARNDTLYPEVNRIFRVNSDLLYASGLSIYKFGSSDVSSIKPEENSLKHSIHNIYPNPFNSEFRFNVTIDDNTLARIDLFNSKGILIHNFHNGRIGSGTYEFSMNPENFKAILSGNYYVVLRTNEGFLTEKVIKSF